MENHYLDGIDIIYWINLDRSKDRYASINKIFKDECFEGIPKERISAFDGKLNPTMLMEHFVLETKKQPDTAYGCLLSHLESIRTFHNSSHDIALILEDDINLEFKKYWKETVKQIMQNAPSDWDIIMLSYTLLEGDIYYHWDKVKSNYKKDLTASCLSYIINKKGSAKIMDSYKDKWILDPTIWTHASDGYIYLKTNTYAYKYPMFTYNDDIDSTINEAHLSINKPSKDAIVAQYKTLYPDL
jgi:GR25 family glycosyltransferase involved in LPS biosynthesis